MSSMLLAAAAAAVTPVPTITAEQALANAQAFYRVTPPKRQPCQEPTGNEIVVCAQQEDPAKQYVPSDIDNGDPGADIPRAPDISTLPQGGMRIGKMPVHPLIIDVKALPEAPAGSDADKMSKGEIPTP
jgi:hypothetical protein